MKTLNYYCKKCLGCNKLEDKNFQGTKECIAFIEAKQPIEQKKNFRQQIILDGNKVRF